MELVYLWVEENDLIKGTDFNFGSKYTFLFKENASKNQGVLSVENNPNYIENFYGNNISISAIVGKNGTGKSQLLRLIWNGDIPKRYFVIIFNDGYYELISATYSKDFSVFPDKMQKKYNISLKEDSRKIDNLTNLFYTNETICLETIISHKTITDNFKFLSKECYLKKIINYEVETNEDYIALSQYAKNKNQSIKGRLDTSDVSIRYKKLKYILDSEIFEKILNIIYEDDIIWYNDMQKPRIIRFKLNKNRWLNDARKAKEILDKNYSLPQTIFLYYIYSWFSYIQKEENISGEIQKKYKIIYDKYKKDNFLDKDNFFKEMIDEYSYYDKNNNEIFFSISKKYFILLKQLDEKLLKIGNVSSIEIADNKLIIDIAKNHTSLIKEGLSIAPILQYELDPIMSSGNLAIMQTFAMLYDKLKDIKDDNILLLLDEVEVYLHPNWQKKFLKFLIGFLSSKFRDKNFHIIVATHSPFLLSDIPKSNVVFLEEKEVKIEQTFGANIHTLLSNSFFMEDNLMGEFAKNKITEIKEFYEKVVKEDKEEVSDFTLLEKEYKDNKTKFEQIQSIIGEPFLKTVIKNYLDEVENILFEDKAKEMAIERVIREYGIEDIEKGLKNVKS